MKPGKLLILATLLAGLAASNTASARGWYGHRHHGPGVGVGIVIGAGIATAAYSSYYPRYYYGPRYYYPAPAPYYYYPAPVVVAPTPPPVYVEQQPPMATAPQQPAGYWYYCSNPQGYYPSVQSCPQGWQKVLPQPPSNQ
jgi:hypothetical protein